MSVCSTSENVPPFISKLSHLVATIDPSVARWSDDGTFFIVSNAKEFRKVLSNVFSAGKAEHTFVRQLHYYGFHKFDPTTSVRPGERAWAFSHPNFLREAPERIFQIVRRVSSSGPKASSATAAVSRPSRQRAKRRRVDDLGSDEDYVAERHVAVRSSRHHPPRAAAGSSTDNDDDDRSASAHDDDNDDDDHGPDSAAKERVEALERVVASLEEKSAQLNARIKELRDQLVNNQFLSPLHKRVSWSAAEADSAAADTTHEIEFWGGQAATPFEPRLGECLPSVEHFLIPPSAPLLGVN